MTRPPTDLAAAGAALARRSRAAQGLPPKVTDAAALARTVELLLAPHDPGAVRAENMATEVRRRGRARN